MRAWWIDCRSCFGRAGLGDWFWRTGVRSDLTGQARGHSSVGRAPALQAGGRRFDPVWLHHSGHGMGNGRAAVVTLDSVSDPSGSAGIFDIVKKRICLVASQEGAAALRGRQGLTALPFRQILHKNWSFLSMTSATGLPSDGRTHQDGH
jgi:hypothetical protein